LFQKLSSSTFVTDKLSPVIAGNRAAITGQFVCQACNQAKPVNRLVTGRVHAVNNVLERFISGCTDSGDSSQANHNDQRQHNGVFNRSWSVLRSEETLYLQGEILHSNSPIARYPLGGRTVKMSA
jgi:hypothetical protein